MKKILKKSLAIMGIVAVVISSMLISVSASDIVWNNNNTYLCEDMNNISRISGNGNNVYIGNDADGNPVRADEKFTYNGSVSSYVQTTNTSTWTSRERWSFYWGSNVYKYVDMINYGSKVSINNEDYYSVMTHFDQNDIDIFNQSINIEYDTLYFDLSMIADEYRYSKDWYIMSGIPFMEINQDGLSDDTKIYVRYEWTEHRIKGNEDTGETTMEEVELDKVVQVSKADDGQYYIPVVPFYYENYMHFGQYNEQTNTWETKPSVMMSNVRTNISTAAVTAASYNTNYYLYTLGNAELNQEYPVSLSSFMNQYKVKETMVLNLGTWLLDTVGGFMQFEIFPGVSLIAILGTVVAIPLLIAFLKAFAGG